MLNWNNRSNKPAAFITGATGFIGSALAGSLLESNFRVYISVRKDSKMNLLKNIEDQCFIDILDLSDPYAVSKHFQKIKPHYIYHFAAIRKESKDALERSEMLSSSVRNLINILEAMHVSHPLAMVHAGSSTIYKDERIPLHENSPKEPISFKGLIKKVENDICLHYALKKNLPLRLAIIFRAYGPDEQDDRLIKSSIRRIYSGEPIRLGVDCYKRDYVYIEDLTEGILKLSKRPLTPGTEVNFGSGTELNSREIVGLLEKIIGKKANISPVQFNKSAADRKYAKANISRAKELLDWTPATTIEEGLAQICKTYIS